MRMEETKSGCVLKAPSEPKQPHQERGVKRYPSNAHKHLQEKWFIVSGKGTGALGNLETYAYSHRTVFYSGPRRLSSLPGPLAPAPDQVMVPVFFGLSLATPSRHLLLRVNTLEDTGKSPLVSWTVLVSAMSEEPHPPAK